MTNSNEKVIGFEKRLAWHSCYFLLFLPMILLPLKSVAENNLCTLHHETLKKDRVPIIYGEVQLDPEKEKARENQFPYSNKVEYGGCEFSDESPKNKTLLYCKKCRDAEEKWDNDHRSTNKS